VKRLEICTNVDKTHSAHLRDNERTQKLVITDDGKVLFTTSTSYKNYRGRSEEAVIEVSVAESIIDKVAYTFREVTKHNQISSGNGLFDVIIKNGGSTVRYIGSTSEEMTTLSQYIQDRVPIAHLELFG